MAQNTSAKISSTIVGLHGARKTEAAPGHRVESVNRPSHGNHERDLLQPCRKHEARHPGAAEHHHHEHGERRDATRRARRLADRRDEQPECGRHQRAGDRHGEKADEAAMDLHVKDDHRESERHDEREQRDDRATRRLAGEQQRARNRCAPQTLPEPALPLEQDVDAEIGRREEQELDAHAGKRVCIAVVVRVAVCRLGFLANRIRHREAGAGAAAPARRSARC